MGYFSEADLDREVGNGNDYIDIRGSKVLIEELSTPHLASIAKRMKSKYLSKSAMAKLRRIEYELDKRSLGIC